MRKKSHPATRKDLLELNCLQGEEPSEDLLDKPPLRPLLEAILAEAEEHPRFGVFGYGSLMWDPEFEPASSQRARIYGYARRPCIKSTTYRGTPRRPGLVLGLDAGGSCTGLALGVPRAQRTAVMRHVMVRECFHGVYWPRVLTAHVRGGGQLPCLTFVANRTSPAYVAALPPAQVRAIILAARGQRGPCVDYWTATQRHLAAMGIAWDHGLELEQAP